MSKRILNTGHDSICGDCPHSDGWVATGWTCKPYVDPRKTYLYRMGNCPLNTKRGELLGMNKDVRVREGQKKTKRISG